MSKLTLQQKLDANSIPEPNSGCTLWMGWDNGWGHGILYHQGRRMYAHRAAMVCAGIILKDGDCVCHRCDVPSCINPNHLFVGSQADNLRDMRGKGRAAPPPNTQVGVNHHLAVLDEDGVRQMRRLASQGVSARRVARYFGVNWSTAKRVISRTTWKHVP